MIVLAVGAAVMFLSRQTPATDTDTEIQVVASFYPLAYLAQQIGGSSATVVNLTPAGAEPHDYELSPGDLVQLQTADIILLNGAGLEPWSDKVLTDVSLDTQVLIMADAIALPEIIVDQHHEEDHHEDEDHDHGPVDPHFWLDPSLYQQQAALIRDVLITADPMHENDYVARYNALSAELTLIDEMYKNELSSCERRDIVVSHDAFRYLGKRYMIEMVPISGFSPEEEPSSRRLGEIALFAREKGITHIFFETLVSPKLAETIAREIGAETLVLNPIEGIGESEQQNGATYVTLMKENLANLKTAMVCAPKSN